jgi:hypothetical protein
MASNPVSYDASSKTVGAREIQVQHSFILDPSVEAVEILHDKLRP